MSRESIGPIIAQVFEALRPALVNAVVEATHAAISKMAEKDKALHTQLSSALRLIQQQRFEIDSLEQYSRKDNIKISGLDETLNEDTTQAVIELAKEIFFREDIHVSIAHRIPTKGDKPNPVIVKFTRRETKIQMMKNKKNLKHSTVGHGKVFISEDLTKLRSKMMYAIRNDEDIKTAFNQGGSIFCYQKLSEEKRNSR